MKGKRPDRGLHTLFSCQISRKLDVIDTCRPYIFSCTDSCNRDNNNFEAQNAIFYLFL